MDTFKLFINPKTRNAPQKNVAECKEKVETFEEPSQNKSAQKDKVSGEPRAKEKEEDKLKARLKDYGSNITFTSMTSKPSKSELKNKHPTGQTPKVGSKKLNEKTKDEVGWTAHPLLPKGWRVAPLVQKHSPSQLLPGLKVQVHLQGEDKETKIQLRAPGGQVLGSHGEAAAFMEEEGSYGEEDIQNLYKVTLETESKKGSNPREGTSRPAGLIPGASRRPGGTLPGGSGLHALIFLFS